MKAVVFNKFFRSLDFLPAGRQVALLYSQNFCFIGVRESKALASRQSNRTDISGCISVFYMRILKNYPINNKANNTFVLKIQFKRYV